jgi:hypothetical protein
MAAVTARSENDIWWLDNGQLEVRIEPGPGRLSITHKRTGRVWTTPESAAQPGTPRFRNLRRAPEPARGLKLEVVSGTNQVTIDLGLAESGTDLFVEVGMADRQTPIRDLFPLEPVLPSSTQDVLIVADYCNGHLYPLDGQPLPRTWFNLWSIDMPWVGVCDLAQGHGYAVIVQTDDDACIRLVKTRLADGGQVWAPQVGFQPSYRQFRYARRFFYHFASEGGYVALAKRFRQYARQQGWVVTLAEKLKANPNIARLFGAPDVWGDASLQFARAAQAAGVEKMIIHGRTSSNDMATINALGYLTSEYDNYTDILQVEPGREPDAQHGQIPDDVVLKAEGQRMTAWLTWDKKQYMKRCPALWVPTARLVVPKVLAQRPFLGRFIDVTTAEDLYECYDPKHPLTRSAKRDCGVALLSYVRSLGLVTGGEHGRYWAVPYLDYIEGMQSGGFYSWPAGHLIRPKSKDQQFASPWGGKYHSWDQYQQWGLGHAWRVPLWELVFHDCIVSTWYWGDASDFLLEAAPEVTPKKDAFNVLYGTIPLLWANKQGSWVTARDTFLRTYRNTCKLHQAIAGTEMLSHEFLTPDRAVQRTRFSDGTTVVVNFGEKPFEARLGEQTWLLPQNGFAVRGPRIEQTRALVNGKVHTHIRTKGWEFSEAE